MGIDFRILGLPGRDNALFVHINKGYATHRLLFDCGAECLDVLKLHELQAIEHLFFSHLHMDHISGFDTFFRANFNRDNRPNVIWGPPQTARIMQHRFQGYMWNLREKLVATWQVNDVADGTVDRWRCEAREVFDVLHHEATTQTDGPLVASTHFSVTALTMDHLTPSLGYVVRESPRINIDEVRLAALGLRPGEWLKYVKERTSDEAPMLLIDGEPHDLAALRAELIIESPGESVAYLTDFLLDDAAMERLAIALKGCTTMICECQYRNADVALAERHHHMMPDRVATLARRAAVGKLILFHLSERYDRATWGEMLADARAIFPNTHFPEHWDIEG